MSKTTTQPMDDSSLSVIEQQQHKQYINKQGIENTQGLIKDDLLLPWGESQSVQSNDSTKEEKPLSKREQKGLNLFENDHVTLHDDETSTILSEDGKKEYLVNHTDGTCECRDHEFRGDAGIICGHRVADRLARDAVNAEITSTAGKDSLITVSEKCEVTTQ